MKKLSLNEDWIVRPLSREGAAKRVSIPHDAMIDEPRAPESAGGHHIGWFIGGDYEYTKTLFVPEAWQGQKVVLEFEGVYHNAEVYINGEKAAFRPYGYTNFYVKADRFLRCGADNEIRVIARNADQPNSRWYTGTGLYRPVNLYLGGERHIRLNGVKIRTINHRTGEIEVLVRVSQPGEIRVEIRDGEWVVANRTHVSKKRSVLFRLTVPEPKLWDTERPNLYICRVTFGDDVVEEHFGIRSLRWSRAEGLTINGSRVILRGACVHHDNGLLGACAFPEAEERKVRLLKETGYNAIRSAHNPCSKAMLDACDQLGMLMLDEYTDCWYIHKTPNDYAKYAADWWQDDLQDMVDKDFNHPCVIMYSIGNEVSETAQPRGIRLAGEMTQYLHELDDTRPVTCGVNLCFNLLSAVGFGASSEEKAGGAIYNKLSNAMGDGFMKYCATLPPADWKTCDAFDNLDVAGYNYGISRYRKDLRKHPDRLILGTETFCRDAWLFLEIAKDNSRVLGDFVWAGMDYIGETGMGVPEYGNYRMSADETRMTGGFGRLDITGKPRAEAAYTRVVYGQQAEPAIAVCPPDQTGGAGLTGWQMTRAIESWAWDGCEGMPAAVEVYARAAKVELKLNGASIGKKRVGRNCRVAFNVPWQPGTLTACAYDKNGLLVGECTLTSAADKTVLRLLPEADGAAPGGLCYVRLRFTDENGVWKPQARHRVGVTVENGTLAGLGSGCACVRGSYDKNFVDAYYGEALAILRAGDEGMLVLNAVSDDGQIARVEIPIGIKPKAEEEAMPEPEKAEPAPVSEPEPATDEDAEAEEPEDAVPPVPEMKRVVIPIAVPRQSAESPQDD